MLIKVKVVANAKREKIEQIKDDTWHIAVREKAQDNAANERVIHTLAHQFDVNPKQVRLIRGHHRPSKTFVLQDHLDEPHQN